MNLWWERIENFTLDDEFDAVCIDLKPEEITKFPAKQHARSVAKHLGVTHGLIYLVGRPTDNIEDSDQPKTFRQRRYFYYLTGVDFEDCAVTYDINKDELRLFIPPVNAKTVIWLGATPSRIECEEKYDVDVVDYTTEIWSYISKVLRMFPATKIYALHEDQTPEGPFAPWSSIKSRVNTTLLLPAMNESRVIKSDYEVAMIRKANVVSGHAHESVLRALALADNEAQLEAMFAGQCIARNAKRQAYGIIAASGTNASTLHYQANDQPLEDRELVCLDAGCEWECYASDVTRTFPISGTYSKEAQEIYDIVAKMQEKCIKMIKPGIIFRNLHMLALSIAVKGLMELGILHHGTFDEMLDTGAAFFPHGLGHHIGLEVHDVSGDQRLLAGIPSHHERYTRMDTAALTYTYPYYGTQSLKPNMVITIEPGIYFSRYAMEEVYFKDPKHSRFINKEIVAKYYKVGGVRIEDDILVTKDGYENLTTAAKGEDALKIIREARNQPTMSLGAFW